MDMSAGMLQWLKAQGFHALRALEAPWAREKQVCRRL